MRHVFRSAIVILALFLLLLQASPGLAASPTDDLSSQAWKILELTNQERAKAGLTMLQWNDILASTATDYARDLVARHYFSHTSKEGTMPWDRAKAHGYPTYGWGQCYVGENLAQGFATPEEAMKGWMNSEEHRANILKPEYRELGVGVVADATGRITWVQNFGARPGVLTVVINGKDQTTDTPRVELSITSEEVSSWGSLGKVVQMMVSNRPDFSDATWEPYTSSLPWTLNDRPGIEKVYVRFKDTHGTAVDSSDDIQLTGQPAPILAQATSLFESTAPSLQSVQPQFQVKPEFKLGFKTLASLIPDVVGQPLEEERSTDDGNTQQRTTTGLMVWRRADNWTAFTNGNRTWVNGPYGLQSRSNEERFPWEK